MNKKNINFLLPLLLTSMNYLHAGGLVEQIAGQKIGTQGEPIFIGVIEKRQKQLENVKQEKEEISKAKEEAELKTKGMLEEIKVQLDILQKQLQETPENEYFKKKSATLNETYQVLKDIQRAREQLITLLDEFIKQLNDFLSDPDFNTYKKEHKLQERLFYSFEEIQKLHDQILDEEKRINQLTEQEKNAQAELENQKRASNATRESYKSKKEEIELLTKKIEQPNQSETNFETHDITELLNLEERLFGYKQTLNNLHVKEIEYKIAHLSLQLFIAKSHRDLLKEYLRKIKPSVRVSEADLADAQEKLSKEKEQYNTAKEKYHQESDKLSNLLKKKEKELDTVNKKYEISLGYELDTWDKKPQQTADSYLGICMVGTINAQRLLLEKKHELLDAQAVLEDEKFKNEKLQVQIKESYHKIIAHKFVSEEEITHELKKYDAPKAEANAGLSKYKDRINTVADLLNTQKKVLDNIAGLRKDVEQQKETLFRHRLGDYNRCLEFLNQAEKITKEQVDILGKLTGVYSGITSVINNMLRMINFMTGELESITIWYRPEYAITWNGVKNIIPDMAMFLGDLRSYIVRFKFNTILEKIKNSFKQPITFLIFILKILLIFGGLILFKRYFNLINNVLLKISEQHTGLTRIISLLLNGILSYINAYFIPINIWLLVFVALIFQAAPDPYVYIIFYLLSIPYLLYLTNRFIRFMAHLNVRYDYAFLAPDFQRRFVFVFSALLYASISIFFFREAFMLANYYRSELPMILLAVNFIIFQISLILLIDKEQILNLIPTKNDLWKWVNTQVDTYYYLILLFVIALIIMSNPYVGYGRLVLHILFGLIYSTLLLIGLFWLHDLFKRIASRIFFSTTDEVVRERFANAKTWFGILIIFSFLLFSFLGIIIGAKIWGWPITPQDMISLLETPIMGDPEHPITALSFVRILLFIFMGFVVSYGLNRFVLDKIFNLLLVDAGVQHTVTSISQYIVLIIAIFLGFQNAGLGALVNWAIGALILGIGWVLREPIGDFIAYFIILVQRPVKIGDYVKIDENSVGVVRKITARSVVLRRRNSTTIVVPNSYVITRSIINWNYTRNFVAFDDILITVDYKENPEEISEILRTILESHENILKNPRPVVRLHSFGEYGYIFLVRGFLSSAYTLEQWNIASDIRIAIIKEFDKRGLALALPTRIILNRSDITTKKETH